jgi:hypothetical protein
VKYKDDTRWDRVAGAHSRYMAELVPTNREEFEGVDEVVQKPKTTTAIATI